MQNVFIINGGQIFGPSKGQLNKKITKITRLFMKNKGNEVRITDINDTYDELIELENFLWADIIIWHIPIWWFQLPHHLKKYIDVVFQHGQGKLFASDGRTRTNPEVNYGRGGLLHNKKYTVTNSWNAPEGAFTLDGEIMNQTSVDDGALFGFHKTMEFCGIIKLDSFHFYDVYKNMTDDRFNHNQKKYIDHLEFIFNK